MPAREVWTAKGNQKCDVFLHRSVIILLLLLLLLIIIIVTVMLILILLLLLLIIILFVIILMNCNMIEHNILIHNIINPKCDVFLHRSGPTYWPVFISKAPQGNDRGTMGSKNPPCILEPLSFSAQHGSKTWVSFKDPFPPTTPPSQKQAHQMN